MNKLISKLRDERMLLLLAYFIGVINFFLIKYVNAVIFSRQDTNSYALIMKWMPMMRFFAGITAVFTFLALFLFILRKAPKYKWVGYVLLIMTLISSTFVMSNVDGFGAAWQSKFYFTLNLIHVALNFMLTYLIVSYQFCNKKSYNIVIASKLISTSILSILPFVKLLSTTRNWHGISIIMTNTDTILQFAVIVVLLLSLLAKPDEMLIEDTP